jgi:ribonuclease R
MRQVEGIADEVEESQKGGRSDFRDLQTVTIDGEDAKDLDDAITLTKDGDLYHLGVHIADVSQYVTEGSPLDKEALKRGTSVYLVDRVIPMLPHKLSNGICSLNQGVDRLALSCMMDIDSKGDIVSHKICESVINVTRRMSYHSVHQIIEEQDAEERKEYEELIPMFELMYELADILKAKRDKKGSIDFNFPEAKIILDEKGKPIEVKQYERTKANRIIEEFMLAANQTVAEEFFWREIPFVYRIHENPDMEKIQNLSLFVENYGYTLKIKEDEIHPKELQKLMGKIQGKPEEGLIGRLALRSMKQARYTTECLGHFGLAMKYYCHFTSPIRRYPDLQIHRIIKESIRGGIKEKRQEHYQRILPEVAEQSSAMERRAEEAEREVDKMKKAEYMEQFVGEHFEGVISGLTNWGIYVELPNTIEGMIRVADIPGDYYYYDDDRHRMVGEETGKVFKLGETVRVVVAGVDKLVQTVDFVLEDSEEPEEAADPSAKKSGRRAKKGKEHGKRK